MWSFAWQNLITRKSRTSLAVLGLTIPVLAFLGLFSVSQGIRNLMGSALGRMQGLLVLRENAPSPVFSDLPAGIRKTLEQIPGVRLVAPELWKLAPPIDGKGGVGAAAMGLMLRPREQGLKGLASMTVIEGQSLPEHMHLESALFSASLLPKDRGGGRFLNMDDVGKPNVVISTKIARDFANADGSPKKVGETLKIGKVPFTIIGIYDTGSFVTDVTLVMEISTARNLLGLDESAVSTFAVEPVNVAQTDALAERIEMKIPEVRAQRVSQFNLTVGSIMGKLDLFLLFAVSLALLVGAVGIANTMLMSTSERYTEFGVMRANGWTRRNILILVTTESALLGVLSGVLGCAVAASAVFTANRFLRGFELDLTPALIATSLAGAVAIAVVSGLYPAWRASTMTPMDAIRRSEAT
jgi:putative ABC transport system permease protein